jgi:hypothetical protein
MTVTTDVAGVNITSPGSAEDPAHRRGERDCVTAGIALDASGFQSCRCEDVKRRSSHAQGTCVMWRKRSVA